MKLTPTTVDDYGGAKQNYQDVADASTDVDATDYNELVSEVGGLTHGAIRGWYTFVGGAGATPGEPASNIHDAAWGNDNSYKPTPSRASAGVYDITWVTTVSDDLDNPHTLNIRRALRPNIDGSTLYHSSAEVTAANVIRVRVWNSAGAAADPTGANVTVAWL